MPDLELKVVGVTDEAPMVKSFELADVSGGNLPGFMPGAHIRVRLPDGDDRPYSLVNLDPAHETGREVSRYRLGVRLEDPSQGGSSFMHALQPGATLCAAEPKNDFALAEADDEAPAVLIAGGIGITPIASMVTELLRRERRFVLHYSGRARGSLAFLDRLRTLLGDSLKEYYDDVEGQRFDVTTVLAAASPDQQLYVCGPKGMIEAVQAEARRRGWPEEKIHFELFTPPAPKAGDKPFDIEIASSGETLTVKSGETIIEVLEAAGYDPLYDCQRGECGICQTGVIAGEPDHRDMILTDSEKTEGKVMQICVSRARSAKLVLDL